MEMIHSIGFFAGAILFGCLAKIAKDREYERKIKENGEKECEYLAPESFLDLFEKRAEKKAKELTPNILKQIKEYYNPKGAGLKIYMSNNWVVPREGNLVVDKIISNLEILGWNAEAKPSDRDYSNGMLVVKINGPDKP